MSIGSRKRRAEQKKATKRAAKSARRALYASYAGSGKRKKNQGDKKGPSSQRGNHVTSDCGNVGCEQCYPQYRVLRANESGKGVRKPVVMKGVAA